MNLTPSLLTDHAKPRRLRTAAVRRFRAFTADAEFRKGALSIFDQAVVSGTNFGTSVIIGRLCERECLGVYALALSIVYFARGIQEQLVSAPYAVYSNRFHDDALTSYTGSVLIHQFLFAFVTVIGLLMFAGLLTSGRGPEDLLPVVWVLLGAVPLLLLREVLRHLAFAHFEMRTAVILDVVVAVLQLGSLVLLGRSGLLSIPAVYAVMGGASLVACTGWLVIKRQTYRVRWSRITKDWLHNWGLARWALAGQLVGCSSPYIMPWFVAAADGTAATGVLAAGTTLVGVANMFVLGLSNFLTPRAARAFADGGIRELRGVLLKIAGAFVCVLGSFCLVVWFAGDLLAVTVYGRAFEGTGPIIAVLAVGMLANSLSITAGNGLWAIEKPSANFLADVCVLVTTIATAVWWVPMMGAMGAAWSILAGTSISAVVRGGTLIRLMRRLNAESAVS